MTSSLWGALLFQVAAVALLAVALRRRYWHHLGALFVTAAVLYHGVAEVLNRLSPGGIERQFLTADEFDRWMTTVGPAILLFTVGYLLTLGKARHKDAADDYAGLNRTRIFFKWKPLAILVAPMYLLSLRGKVSGSTGGPNGATYLQSGLTSQFLLIGIVLLSYALVVEYGPDLALKVLVVQSVALILLGERLTVVAAGLMLLWALTRLGLKVTRRQIAILLILTAASALVISSSRSISGRDTFAQGGGSGPSSRLAGVTSGLGALATGHASIDFAQQYSQRLDGNDFATWIFRGLNRSNPHAGRMGFRSLENDFWLAIPSALSPHKLNTDVTTRNEEAAVEAHFSMPPMNRLPTTLGTLGAYQGSHWMQVFAILLGVLFGLADRWLKRESPARLVIGVCLVSCVAFYEGSPAVYPVTLRGGLLLVGVIGMLRFAQANVRRKPAERAPADMWHQ